MDKDKNEQAKPGQNEKNANPENDQQKLNVKNPFNENDNKVITPQDVEGEQDFKEAQTERD